VIKEYVMRISSYGTTNRHFNNNTSKRFMKYLFFEKLNLNIRQRLVRGWEKIWGEIKLQSTILIYYTAHVKIASIKMV
jgi:hypothetical protein